MTVIIFNEFIWWWNPSSILDSTVICSYCTKTQNGIHLLQLISKSCKRQYKKFIFAYLLVVLIPDNKAQQNKAAISQKKLNNSLKLGIAISNGGKTTFIFSWVSGPYVKPGRKSKDCAMGQAKRRCVGLPLEYQRVPASERVRPSVIKHALLMMRLSLLHWWGKERHQRLANWSQFLHGWVWVYVHLCMPMVYVYVCSREHVGVWLSVGETECVSISADACKECLIPPHFTAF